MAESTKRHLEAQLARAHEKYHIDGEPTMSDEQYDRLAEKLRRMSPTSPVVSRVGAPVDPRVAVPLPRRMGSLDKARTVKQLRQMTDRSGRPSGGFLISDKLDGQSALIHALSPTQIRMYTRGDGVKGRDITRLYEHLDGVPLAADLAAKMAKLKISLLRGELIVPKTKRAGTKARNFVTGVVNSNSPSAADLGDVRFVAYEACGRRGACEAPGAQLETLRSVLAHVVSWKRFRVADLSVEALTRELLHRKEESEYVIDGLVVAADAPYADDDSRANPAHAFAFKAGDAESREVTTVRRLEWNASRQGRLIPTVLVDPVELNGSRVERASGKNAADVLARGIGAGAEVELVMSGDVIPDISRVIKRSPADSMPAVPHEWDANRVHLVVIKPESNASVRAARLTHFFATLPVKGFGASAAEKLVAAGVVDAIGLVNSNPRRLNAAVGGSRGEALLDAVGRALWSADATTLALANGMFPDGVGKKTLKLALDSGLKDVNLLENVPGVGRETAAKLAQGFLHFDAFVAKLVAAGALPREFGKTTATQPRGGAAPVVVFSGFRDKSLEDAVFEAGGTVTTAVTPRTDFVVVKHARAAKPASQKVQDARRLGVRVVAPNWSAIRANKV